MRLSDLQEAINIMPKAQISIQGSAIMIKDRNGKMIGDIIPATNTLRLYKDYEHFQTIAGQLDRTLFDIDLQRVLLHGDPDELVEADP